MVSKAVNITTSMLGINVFQPLQHLDAGHGRHVDVEDGDIHLGLLGQFDGAGAVPGHEDLVIVLEDDPQRLAHGIFVIHDQKGAFADVAAPSARAASVTVSKGKVKVIVTGECR